MTATGALARASGTVTGDRRSGKDLAADRTRPPWRDWKTKTRHGRAIRFIETYLVVPAGAGANRPLRLAPYQKHALEELLAPGVRTGGLQIPRGNAKSTLCAALGLWALLDADEMTSVPLIAYNSRQARSSMFKPLVRMIELSPELQPRTVVYSSEHRIWSAHNAGELVPLPAEADRLQGLNPSIALVDEAQTVTPDVFGAVVQGAGKRPESLVLAIGTPQPGAQASALYDLRDRAQRGARVAWVEYAAAEGCALDDRREWHRANPALKAGILAVDVLEDELATVDEIKFRSYRLGQWLDVSVSSWLPVGAWDALPHVDAPPADTEIVVGLAGTWETSIAVVGSTLDGEIFVAWAAPTAENDQIRTVVEAVFARWQVREIVTAPRFRPELVRSWVDAGLDVTVWPATRGDLEVASAVDFRQAIVEGRIAHDHDETLAAHMAAVVGRTNPDGSLRLDAPDDGTPVDAARAARLAWWRARDVASEPVPMIY